MNNKSINFNQLKHLLDESEKQFNTIDFIEDDPISIPHQFTQKQDIEIAAFFAATLAWGQRKTIINSCKKLLMMMDNAPFDFIQNHSKQDLRQMNKFVHRTFNYEDLLYFVSFLNHHYKNHKSLQTAFFTAVTSNAEQSLIHFYNYFFSLDNLPQRTKKHIATPLKNSSCKRLNMFLRWMVRHDKAGVDFGIWSNITASKLICPVDVHVLRVANKLRLIDSSKPDWKTAVELTNQLSLFCKEDPVKYDYALFGLGVSNII